MKFRIAISALLLDGRFDLPRSGSAHCYVRRWLRATQGLNLTPLDGVLHYALSASEIVQIGYYGAGEMTYSTVLSGNVAYTAKSTVRPFSMIFAGRCLYWQPIGTGHNELLECGGFAGLVTRKLGLQHLRLVQLSAAIANDRSIGYSRRRRSWRDPGTRAGGQGPREGSYRMPEIESATPGWQCGAATRPCHVNQRCWLLVGSHYLGDTNAANPATIRQHRRFRARWRSIEGLDATKLGELECGVFDIQLQRPRRNCICHAGY